MATKSNNKRKRSQISQDSNKELKEFANGKKLKFPTFEDRIKIRFGKFTAASICLEEVAINNQILRVDLTVPIRKRGRSSKSLGILKTPIKSQSIKKPLSTSTKSTKTTRSSLNLQNNNKNRGIVQQNKNKSETSSIQYIVKRQRRKMVDSDSGQTTSTDDTDKKNSIVNLSPPSPPKIKYYLKYPSKENLNERQHQSKLSLDFAELPAVLRSVKLPGPTWKIKIFMKDIMTMSISVTNNQTPERSIVFTAKNQDYQIIVEDELIKLLGCPETLRVAKDFEALVNIVNCISLTDCMVFRLKKRKVQDPTKYVKKENIIK